MDTREFRLKHELIGGRDLGDGYREFMPLVTNCNERYEMQTDLDRLGVYYKVDFCDVEGHPDIGKPLLIFTLWAEEWKGVRS
jgi:hypothetical protein